MKPRLVMFLCVVALTAVQAVRADLITTSYVFNVNGAVPDNDEFGFVDTQEISGFAFDDIILSIDVNFKLSGDPDAFNGDFFAYLSADNGGYAVLLNRVGRTGLNLAGYSDNGFDITFTAGAPDIHLYQALTNGFAGPLTGFWGSDGRVTDPDFVLDGDPRTATLNSFTNLNPNASYTLFVADLSLGGTAIVESWGMEITVVPEPGTALLVALGSLVLTMRRKWLRA